MASRLLFTAGEGFDKGWPFTRARMVERLKALGEVDVLDVSKDKGQKETPISALTDLAPYAGISHFGGAFTAACLAKAKSLKALGVLTDNSGGSLPMEELAARGIPVIDSTRAWAQSVAECGFTLTLCAMRQLTHWHHRMANKDLTIWERTYGQFDDDPRFVNGDLGTKTVGVLGLGQIGSRLAKWSVALGAKVLGYDPYVPAASVKGWGVEPVAIDALVDRSDVVMVAIPGIPAAKNLLSAERIARLRKGAIVMIVTRAMCVDMEALRKRILADELAGAFDVYDREPVPADDPLLGRRNVVHTPHIAGRTRDSNWRVADVIADDFARILKGEAPQAALTLRAAAVRQGKA